MAKSLLPIKNSGQQAQTQSTQTKSSGSLLPIKQSTFQEDRDAIERGFHQQAVEQIAPDITQNYQQHMQGLQNVINQAIGGQKQSTQPTDYKQQIEQKRKEYHQALGGQDLGEEQAKTVEMMSSGEMPVIGKVTKPLTDIFSTIGNENQGALEKTARIGLDAMQIGMNAIPMVAGMNVASELAVPVVKGVVTPLTNEQVGNVAGTLTELGIAAAVDPAILVGMLASKGASTISDKLVEGTTLTNSQKQLVSELVGQTAFFAGMAKGSRLIKSGKNAISEWATADELPQFIPKGLDASNIRGVGETSGTPTIVPKLRADAKSIAVVNNAEIELAKARENGTKFDESIITKNIENVKDPVQQAKLGQLYTDALQHNKELSQKGKPSGTETKEPTTSEVPIEQGKPTIEQATEQTQTRTTFGQGKNQEIVPVESASIQQVPIQEPMKEVGTGEKKVRGLSKSVEKGAIARALVDTFGDLPMYSTMNKPQQEKLALSLIDADYNAAKSIAMGTQQPPQGLYPESVYTAVRKIAEARNDIETLRDLSIKSNLNTEATIMGQRIKALDSNSGDADPVKAMKELSDIRQKAIENRLPNAKEAVASEIGTIKQSISKYTPKRLDWETFIKSIEC